MLTNAQKTTLITTLDTEGYDVIAFSEMNSSYTPPGATAATATSQLSITVIPKTA